MAWTEIARRQYRQHHKLPVKSVVHLGLGSTFTSPSRVLANKTVLDTKPSIWLSERGLRKARNTQQIGGPRCAERDARDDHYVVAGLSEISRECGIAGELRHRRLIGDFVFDHDRINSPYRCQLARGRDQWRETEDRGGGPLASCPHAGEA